VTGLPVGSDAALAPLRAALLETTRTSAAAIVADAETQAAAILNDAKQQADLIRSDAAARGDATARSEALVRSALARRQAHETVLREQSALRRELQRQVRDAAVALRADPRYPALLDRLGQQCRAILGPEATVAESADGGVTARADSREIDLSLPVIATRTLESMGREVSPLWTP
jgi:vacuolar-type H+-ATPase subunit E/Vma4